MNSIQPQQSQDKPRNKTHPAGDGATDSQSKGKKKMNNGLKAGRQDKEGSINKIEQQVKEAWANAQIEPREHQWKTCVNIVEDISCSKSGQNYLIQHAAGSGKSLTIACLVVQLYNLIDNGACTFDKILVMNDRTQLDVQLGDVIVHFLAKNNIDAWTRPKSSKALEHDLTKGDTRIVITTMQKFAKLLLPQQTLEVDGANLKQGDGEKCGDNGYVISAIKNCSIAIISDEAHRSHGKATTRHLHAWLGGSTQQARHITYFSFTCTPTRKCLEMFGTPHLKSIKQPFYTYSMRDAIRDGLVLDVTQHYSTVVVLAKMTPSSDSSSTTTSVTALPPSSDLRQSNVSNLPLGESDPQLNVTEPSSTAESKLLVSSSVPCDYSAGSITPVSVEDSEKMNNPSTAVYSDARKAAYHVLRIPGNDMGVMREKARYIVNHLAKALKEIDSPIFKARAMLVTEGRKQILWYKHFIEEQMELQGQNFEVVAAFSPFTWNGRVWREHDSMVNGKHNDASSPASSSDRLTTNTSTISVSQLLKNDVETKIRVLIAAEKFQTGFDEPSLAIMYVDKRLQGAHCVQTLGRLSRVAPGKTQCYVVDFANTRREVADSFAAYWDTTTLQCFSSPDILEIRLRKAAERLLAVPPIQRGDINESVEYIINYDNECKQKRVKPVIESQMTLFLELCDRLQLDNNPDLRYKFVLSLLTKLRTIRAGASIEAYNKLAQSVQVSVEYVEERTGGSIKKKNSLHLTMRSPATRQALDNEPPMTGSQIISTANQAYHRRLVDLLNDDGEDEGNPVFANAQPPELDTSNMNFIKEIWQGQAARLPIEPHNSSTHDVHLARPLPHLAPELVCLSNAKLECKSQNLCDNSLKQLMGTEMQGPPPQIADKIEMVVNAIAQNGPQHERELRARKSGREDLGFLDPAHFLYPFFKRRLQSLYPCNKSSYEPNGSPASKIATVDQVPASDICINPKTILVDLKSPTTHLANPITNTLPVTQHKPKRKNDEHCPTSNKLPRDISYPFNPSAPSPSGFGSPIQPVTLISLSTTFSASTTQATVSSTPNPLSVTMCNLPVALSSVVTCTDTRDATQVAQRKIEFLRQAVMDLEKNIGSGSVVDECTRLVQDIGTLFGGKADADIGKRFVHVLFDILRVSTKAALHTSGSDMRVAVLNSLGTTCKSQNTVYDVYELKGSIATLVALIMSPTAKFAVVEEASKTLAVLATICGRIRKQVQQHVGLRTQVQRLTCSKSRSLCAAANALRLTLQDSSSNSNSGGSNPNSNINVNTSTTNKSNSNNSNSTDNFTKNNSNKHRNNNNASLLSSSFTPCFRTVS